jgi:hypothetical protein
LSRSIKNNVKSKIIRLQMDYSRSNEFNAVYIIESLPDGDFKTGRDLFEISIYPLGAIKEGLDTNLGQPRSKSEFFKELSSIIDNCEINARSPILHIDAHGNNEGIATASMEFITWAELKPFLCKLNEISGLNLLVVMAACNGMDLAKVILPTDRAPVWGIIGPQTAVKAGRVLDGFKAFYSKFFEAYDGIAALNCLNCSPDAKGSEFKFCNAEFFFMAVYKRYLNSLCTEEAITARAERMLKEIGGGRLLHPNDENRIIKDLKNLLITTQEFYFERHKRHFFMMDIIKENEKRFDITPEQCRTFLKGNGS